MLKLPPPEPGEHHKRDGKKPGARNPADDRDRDGKNQGPPIFAGAERRLRDPEFPLNSLMSPVPAAITFCIIKLYGCVGGHSLSRASKRQMISREYALYQRRQVRLARQAEGTQIIDLKNPSPTFDSH